MSEPHANMMVTPAVRLVRRLGEGGMGSVWIADHLALHTQVVVKFISEELAKNPDARARFTREAAAASNVKSPHVVQTFDHGITDDGRPYIVMELLEGCDLGAQLERHGRLTPGEVANIVTQLGRALDRAHARGIVHRDIKPENVFLCDQGSDEVFVKLLDFGIAKGVDVAKLDGGTKTGSAIGTPYYMSPEQLLGAKTIDHRSDLWSVGVVAFEALTGTKPFLAETVGGIAVKATSEPLPMPTVLRPDLPAAIDAWFSRACAREPEERFSSAKEMAEALARAVTGFAPTVPVMVSRPAPRVIEAEAPARTAATDAGIVRSRGGTRGVRGRLAVALAAAGVLAVLATAAVSVPNFVRGRARPAISPAAGEIAVPGVNRPTPTESASIVAAPPPPPSATTPAVAAEPVAKPSADVPRRPPLPARKSEPKAGVLPSTPAKSEPAAATPSAQPTAPRPSATSHDIF